MGSTLGKEEAAVVKLLQHILSKRGLSYQGNLRRVLLWARQRGLIPSVTAAFEPATWKKIIAVLWDDISSGSKDSRKLSTVWRLVLDTLKELKAELQTPASAFTARSAEAERAGSQDSVTAGTFVGSLFPKAAPKRRDGDASRAAPVRQENQEQKSTALLQIDSPSPQAQKINHRSARPRPSPAAPRPTPPPPPPPRQRTALTQPCPRPRPRYPGAETISL